MSKNFRTLVTSSADSDFLRLLGVDSPLPDAAGLEFFLLFSGLTERLRGFFLVEVVLVVPTEPGVPPKP